MEFNNTGAQGLFKNLISGILVLVERFKVGDWIFVDEVEGTVENIGFRSTVVRDLISL